MTYYESSIPDGCHAEDTRHVYGTTLTIRNGVSSDEATAFATEHNSTLLFGSSPTVSVSGGWILGAGYNVLPPVYGSGIDRLIRFTIVTPDGILRTTNAFQNTDLFWAEAAMAVRLEWSSLARIVLSLFSRSLLLI